MVYQVQLLCALASPAHLVDFGEGPAPDEGVAGEARDTRVDERAAVTEAHSRPSLEARAAARADAALLQRLVPEKARRASFSDQSTLRHTKK